VFLRFREFYLFAFFFYSTMNECHRLGIKNFKSNRYPGQIKLSFDLCDDDTSAPRHISSKGDGAYQKVHIPNYDKLKFNYFPIKKPMNDRLREYKCSKALMNSIGNILYVIFCVLCIIFKYTICLVWCVFKIFLCTIFRILTESRLCRPKGLICHPIRCHHCRHQS
jgi:hypothetical protein